MNCWWYAHFLNIVYLFATIPCPFPEMSTTSKLGLFNIPRTGSGVGMRDRMTSMLGTMRSSSNNDGRGLLLRMTILADLPSDLSGENYHYFLSSLYKVIIIILNVISNIMSFTLGTWMCALGSSLNRAFVITSLTLAMSHRLYSSQYHILLRNHRNKMRLKSLTCSCNKRQVVMVRGSRQHLGRGAHTATALRTCVVLV